MALPGTKIDEAFGGAFTKLVPDMKDAQCFVMSSDVTAAVEEVCMSKPSSMLGALQHMRVPYPRMWVEWEPDSRSKLVHHNDKPAPKRMGCFIMTDKHGNRGTAVYMWEHRLLDVPAEEEITLDPFGIIFDWSDGQEEPVMVQYARIIGMPIERPTWEKKYTQNREAFKEGLLRGSKWRKLVNFDKELDAYMTLEKCSAIIPLSYCKTLFESEVGHRLLRPGKKMYEDFMEDLEGEFAYTEAFLLLLNSKNTPIEQKRDDFTRLNKARAKNRKRPLKEFITTHLRVSKVVGNRAASMGMSREAARLHLVRGHFKTKKSGVYWWSPHVRGGNEDQVAVRSNYKVSV
jgi:hypothetical protein